MKQSVTHSHLLDPLQFMSGFPNLFSKAYWNLGFFKFSHFILPVSRYWSSGFTKLNAQTQIVLELAINVMKVQGICRNSSNKSISRSLVFAISNSNTAHKTHLLYLIVLLERI